MTSRSLNESANLTVVWGLPDFVACARSEGGAWSLTSDGRTSPPHVSERQLPSTQHVPGLWKGLYKRLPNACEQWGSGWRRAPAVGTASRHTAASSRTFSVQLPVNAQAQARCQGQAGMDSVHETQNRWLVEGEGPPAGPGRKLSASRNAIRICWNALWAQMGQRGTGQRGPGCA